MLRVLWIVCLSIVGYGCTDPGCIRNSECGPAYRCREARCVPANTETGGHAGSSTTNSGNSDGTGTPQEKPDAAGVEILDAAVASDPPSP